MARPARSRILVVDDDPGFARTLQLLLEGEGYDVEVAHSGAEAVTRLDSGGPFGLVVSDLAMPGMSGLDLLKTMSTRWPHLPLIMMTAHSSIQSAVAAIKLGAFQYLNKPIEPDELLAQIERALEHQSLQRRHEELRARTGDPARFDQLIGSSSPMMALRQTIDRLSQVDSTVLVRGETGVGKELVTRLIHNLGPRSGRPIVVVNCTAIPGDLLESELFGHEKGAFTGATSARSGRIEQADGGTLLLDEIGDMPAHLQPKLLRFLQDRRVQRVGGAHERAVDVRVVAATHRDLEHAIAEGEFREDLYHRLNTIPVVIPPLRDRRHDIEELSAHLLAKVACRLGRTVPRLSGNSLVALESHPFTGNVRELENLLERALVLSDPVDGVIELGDFALRPRKTPSPLEPPLEGAFEHLSLSFQDAERALVRRAVAAWPGVSNEEIARRLGTQRRVLERRMRDYGINKPAATD